MKWTIGVDVGATKVNFLLLDPVGAIAARYRLLIGEDLSPSSVIEKIASGIETVMKEMEDGRLSSVAIACAGQLDSSRGRVLSSPNLHWRDVSLQMALEEKWNSIPFILIQDVRAAAFAEWSMGNGKGEKDLFCFFLGSGVGGCLIADQKIVKGGGGFAGEVGHMKVEIGGRACACGGRGCLEAHVGGKAMAVKMAEYRKLSMVPTFFPEEKIDGHSLARAVQEGDPIANKVLDEAKRALLHGVGSIVNLLNPSLLLFGGGITKGFPSLISYVQERIGEVTLEAPRRKLRIVEAQFKEDAPALGAALLAREAEMS